MKTDLILIIWTAKDLLEARTIAADLLEKKLIACASMIPVVESVYVWKGKLESAQECKVFLKTLSTHFGRVCEEIRKSCSYEVPEILQIAITDQSPDYLAWVKSSVGR